MHSLTTTTGMLWNGPICGTCGARYTCSPADLLRKAADLQREAARLLERASDPSPASQPVKPYDTSSCPCRPENGGSGICGCILGGPRVTC
jgi:hypothetical protein